MAEFSYRTHTCGALRAADVGRSVVLLGWVHRVRNLGGLIFFDVRDRYGLTQVIVRAGSGLDTLAERLRPEFVVSVEGLVEARSPEALNPRMPTGEVEVVAARLDILNEARTPPFAINDESPVAEETRLKLPVPRPAAARSAAQPRAPAQGDDRGAAVLRQRAVPRDRDADPHAVHARRARATTWCRAACIPASSSRCRSRRRSSSRS